MEPESAVLEYKREYTEDIKKTIVAFANGDGGTLLIGVADDGTVVGTPDPDDVMLRTTNAARDAISPDVTLFMSCEVRTIDDERVVAIKVQRGTARPYHLTSKGIRPEGVFVRQGPSTVPASESAILKMIRETSGDDYEATRSLRQGLTFESAGKAFSAEGLPFAHEQMRTLGILGEDRAFTGLGLLLSDQCPHTMKLAVFQGIDKIVFKDRHESTGSLIKQLDDAFAYIERFDRTRSEISGLRRVDAKDYPAPAVREALLNAIVHRDYSYSDSTLISLFDDRMELLTLGGLARGIGLSDVMMGVSVLRNPRLANVFYRLHLIEAFGTGMPKIMACYRGCPAQPIVELSENAFKLTLPNANFQRELGIQGDASLSNSERRVLDHILSHGTTSRAEIQSSLGLSQSMTIRALNRLLTDGRILRSGRGKNVRWSPA